MPPLPRCLRHGCPRPAGPTNKYCTLGCRAVGNEVVTGHRLRDALGSNPHIDHHLEAAENLAAAWQEVQESRYRLRRMALEAGWTVDQWSALLRGDTAATTTAVGDG